MNAGGSRRSGIVEKMRSAGAVLAGARRVVGNPRLLARLSVPSREERDARYQAEARQLLGGLPRTVAIEQLLNEGLGYLPAFSFLDDTSSVLDLLLLRNLVGRSAGRRYFEIGTFRGESAMAVADIASEVVTLSLPDQQLIEIASDPTLVAAHRTFSQGIPQVKHLFGDSRTANVNEYEDWADVLFIDGDHTRDAVESDTRRFWKVRRRETGVVVWHDAFSSPLFPRWEVLAGIAAGLSSDIRREVVHVSNTLCLAWLPDGHTLPTVERSYVPRIAFSVSLEVRHGWRNARDVNQNKAVPPLEREPTESRNG